MSFSFNEKPNSRETTMEPPSISFRYVAAGEPSQDAVRGYALSATPAIISTSQGTLYRQDVRIRPEGFQLYEVEVPYSKQKRENGSMRLSFSTMGGTVNRKVSIQTVAKYPNASSGALFPEGVWAPDMKGAIAVGDDGKPDGVDTVIPTLKLSVHFKHPLGIITLPQIKMLARNTGKVNDSPFLTFEAGEVLFLGASGEEGTDSETTVQYDFACQENLRGITISDMEGIDKDGWDAIWFKFFNSAADGKPTTVPKWVYVERVYYRTNLAAILGFGA